MEFNLKVTTDLHWDFYLEYDQLGFLQKKIWDVSVWWVRKFPNAFPSQERIAQEVGCSRKHVNKTFAKFQKLGWMNLSSRGIKHSKIIGIPNHLLAIDVIDRKAFRKVEVTTQVTHSKSYVNKNTSLETGASFRDRKQRTGPPEKRLEIPGYVQKTKLSLKHKLKLSLVPQNIYEQALESTKYQHAQGNLGDNPERIERYMVGTAIKMAKDRHMKIDWPLYYRELVRSA